jgi:hypothetical protein
MIKRYLLDLRQWKMSAWLAVVAVFAAVQRLALWLAVRPVIYDDTRSYRRLAQAIIDGHRLDGTRSPGFPYFLVWLGADERVYAVQLVLGFLTTLLFFYIGWKLGKQVWAGVAAALAHTLNLGQLLFESNLLAETLTTFLVAAGLAGGAYLLDKTGSGPGSGWKRTAIGLGIGIAGGLASLVRPQFVFVPFLVIFVLFFARRQWLVMAAIFLPAFLLNFAWMNYIHTEFGSWAMSSVDGYHLIQHTGKFFEYAPEEYAPIRDTFLQYRAVQIAKTGSSSNTIWEALPAMREASGLGFYPLSRKLKEISLILIREHPFLFAKSVLEAWAWFWSAPFYWAPESFGAAAGFMRGLVTGERFLLWVSNALFLLGSLALVFKRVRAAFKMPALGWLLWGTVLANSWLQALVEASENPRYSISTQSLVVFLVAWWMINLWNQRKSVFS